MTAISLLVLDDQPEYVGSLSRALSPEYLVLPAHDVREAQDKTAESPALAIVDVRLDSKDPANREGLEFIRWMRGRGITIPVIAMSALDDPALREQSLAAGAVAFASKPVRVSELRGLLQRFLGDTK